MIGARRRGRGHDFIGGDMPCAPGPASDARQIELPLQLPAPQDGERRQLLLAGRLVAYTLRRGSRRRLALVVDQRGLRIGAPITMPLGHIEDFVRDNAQWVLGKLDQWRCERRPARILVCDGARLPLLGAEWTLRLALAGGAVWGERELTLGAGSGADPRPALLAALRQRALEVLQERAIPFAERLPCAMPRIALSEARTRWGSCSRRTGLRFSWRLIHLPPALVDYVIAHEFAHLREMDHSPRFWAVVERLYPDWRSARRDLRSHAGRVPEI
jgi:hypothetical protein